MPIPSGYSLDKTPSLPKGYSLDASQMEPSRPKPEGFTSNPKGEGLYLMAKPGGGLYKIPYGKVMDAYHAGYRIDPLDQRRYAEDRLADIQNTDKSKGIKNTENLSDIPVPTAFREMTSAPKPFSADWWKGKAADILSLFPTAGSIAGGIASGVAGSETGPGDLLIASAGSGAGAALGEDIRQQGMHELYPFAKQYSAGEAAKKIGEQAAFGAVSEGSGRLAGKLLEPAANYFKTTSMASEKAGYPFFPSEAAGMKPSYVERLLKGNVLTAGKMEKFRALQNTQTRAAVGRLSQSLSSFKGDPEELGNLIQAGIEKHKEEFRALQKQLYENIDEMVDRRVVEEPITKERLAQGIEGKPLLDEFGKPVRMTATEYRKRLVDRVMPSTAKLKDFAAKELQELSQEEQVHDPALLSRSRGMLQTILDSPDHVTYQAMADARSDALAAARQFKVALAGKEAGLAKKIASLYDESMMTAAENSKIPGLKEAIETANGLTKAEHEKFEQQLVSAVVKTKRPEAIAALLRRANTGNQETRDLFSVLPKDLHNPVRREVLQSAMRQSTDPNTKEFNERRFADLIGRLGDERGKAIFGNNWSNVKEIAASLERINVAGGLSGGGSGAAFENIGYIKGAIAAAFGAAGAGIGAFVGGHGAVGPEMGAALGASAGEIINIAGNVVTYRTMANAMIHPEVAEKLVKALQGAIRAGAYTPQAAQNLYQGITDKERLRRESVLHSPSRTTVTSPDGQIHIFPTPQAAAKFRKEIGVE